MQTVRTIRQTRQRGCANTQDIQTDGQTDQRIRTDRQIRRQTDRLAEQIVTTKRQTDRQAEQTGQEADRTNRHRNRQTDKLDNQIGRKRQTERTDMTNMTDTDVDGV